MTKPVHAPAFQAPLGDFERSLKAMYACSLEDLMPKHVAGFMKCGMTFEQAVANSATGRLRRFGWGREYHNCHDVWLHYSQVGEHDKHCDDWTTETDLLTQPLSFTLT